MSRHDLAALWDYVLLIAPAPLGALIGLRYATQLSKRQQAANFGLSGLLGVFVALWLGELFNLSRLGVAVATIVACAVGMEVMAGLVAAARAFSADPIGFLGKAFTIFRRGAP